MNPEPHHPTTRELEDMRASLMSAPSLATLRDDHGRPDWRLRTWQTATGWSLHPAAGAWLHERDKGIGYQDDHPSADLHAFARREASAMRRRAYIRQGSPRPGPAVAPLMPGDLGDGHW